jgi:hypothetical protein
MSCDAIHRRSYRNSASSDLPNVEEMSPMQSRPISDRATDLWLGDKLIVIAVLLVFTVGLAAAVRIVPIETYVYPSEFYLGP